MFKRKEELLNILFMIVSFIVALNLYNIFRYFGLEDMVKIKEAPVSYSEITFNAFLGGTIVGLIIGIADNILNNYNIRQKPFGFVVMLKTVFFIFTFFLTITVVFLITHIYLRDESMSVALKGLKNFYLEKSFYSLIIYGMIVIFIINSTKQINRKMGPGILLKFFSGRYHSPREETRIFMFLDLRSSTTIAENLGHIRFSRLLQDCFNDLTEVVKGCKAEIYQYVGDEVVLTWKLESGLKDLNCARFYFVFRYLIESRRTYYIDNYGIVPEFKAGMNCGKVTVAEVGEVKSEIAYHGDVLNTAARIQSKCNDLQKDLLISENINEYFNSNNEFITLDMGEILLKGKLKPINVFSVEKV